jgi:hypothetical protein
MNIFLKGRGFKVLWILLALATPPLLRAQVVINEVMANNNSAVPNEGIFPDWVELYNNSAASVDLSDWSISDTLSNTRRFIFPAGTTIAANGFLMVWFDTLTNAPGLHVGSTISATTDDISLYGPSSSGGIRQDVVNFGLQVPDRSISRIPNGTGTWTLTTATPAASNDGVVTLGDPANLRINEVMANPNGGDDWFELYNTETNYVALGGLVFTDHATLVTNRAVPALSFIVPHGFIQFIADRLNDGSNLDADHTDFALNNTAEQVVLYQANRTTQIDRQTYTTAQTNGVSFGRLPDGGTNIVYFAAGRSTPGASNFQLITDILINEVLSHTDPPLEDAIELFNPTANPVDISYWWLSNSEDNPKKFRIPPGTVVPPRGYKVFYEWPGNTNGFNFNGQGTNLSFTLNSARGDQVYLHTADASGNLTFFRTSRDFGPAENGVSFGRYVTSEGKTDFPALSRRTFGADNPNTLAEFRTGDGLTNAYPKIGPLVINEIMYHPPDIGGTNDNGLDEYIEIYNIGSTNVRLFDPIIYPFANGQTNTWRLRGVVDFNFPTNITLAASNYLLLVNFNPQTNLVQLDEFRAKFSVPTNVQIFGPYSSKLANGGGSIELYRPDVPQPPGRPDEGLVPYIRVEKVEYNDTAPWPVEADGLGSALQRLHVQGYGNDPTNWVASAPTPGSVFIPNTAPAISPISDLTTNEMRRISFFVSATDTNFPAQTITFTLEPGAPAGATISPGGEFRWRPTEEQGPGNYTITVRATDNGSPPMSSTRSFQITLNEVNRPPCFNIRERWVKAGNTLSFMTAHDEDVPPQFMDFSVIGAAPAGLSIDPGTGQVTWTPAEAQAGTNAYFVTVQATDDGVPNLTSQFTYTIHVLPSTATLIVGDVFNIGQDVVISWEATTGKTYFIEYTESLVSPNWLPASDFIGALGSPMSWSEPRVGPRRFYRIQQID